MYRISEPWPTHLISLFVMVSLFVGCGPQRHYELEIDSSVPWTMTDIMIPSGSQLTIEAYGAISPNGSEYVDADGSSDEDWNRNYNMYPRINHCSLIARIGAGGEVFAVGVSNKKYISEGGRLLLGINDNNPENNEGTLKVIVQIDTVSAP